MKTILCCIGLMLLAATCFGSAYTINERGSYLRVTALNSSDIQIELNFGSCVIDETGAVKLPSQLQKYCLDNSKLPIIAINLAVAEAGDYQMEKSLHNQQIPLVGAALDSQNGEAVVVSKPYRLREIQGIELRISPFQIRSGILNVSDHLTITLRNQNPRPVQQRRINPYFTDIYQSHFLNFSYRYQDMAEYGSMAVICPPEFNELIMPWVQWKNQKGIPTTVYSTELTGHTYESTKAFIQNLYNNDPNLTFVQLVGDYAQIPCIVNGTDTHFAGRDADYTLLDGDDWYPDIFVGRFSAETSAELWTQVKRSLEYEKDLAAGDWLSRASGVCSNLPPIPGDDNEHNWEHLDNIRTKLLANGFTSVDRIYANEGSTGQDFIDSINGGVSLLNYCGEGYPTYILNPPLTVDDAMALTNTGMLPFIHSVACSVGQFFNTTCLAEALLRSRDATSHEARGAIAMYASGPTQGIAPPMRAQDHSVDLLVKGTKNTIGGLCYNGASNMNDVYGGDADNGGIYNFYGWNLFGDCSLVLRTKPAEEILATLPDQIVPGSVSLFIQTDKPNVLASLSINNSMLASAFSDSSGALTLNWTEAVESRDRLLLTLTGFNCKTVQHYVYCYADGQVVLNTTITQSTEVVETEMEIPVTVTLTNTSDVPAYSLCVLFYHEDQNFIPINQQNNIGTLGAGETVTTTLSYKVSKQAADLSTVEFDVMVSASYYSQSYACSQLVHAPKCEVISVKREPQCNWITPGDTFKVTYYVENTGGIELRNVSGHLESSYDALFIENPNSAEINIAPGCVDSLSFMLSLRRNSASYWEIDTCLNLNSSNAAEFIINQSWLSLPPQVVMESFETGDLSAFPWESNGGNWTVTNQGWDGYYCLQSPDIPADSVSLSIDFAALQAGELSFVYYMTDNDWQLYHNGVLIPEYTFVNQAWNFFRISLPEGDNTLTWVGSNSSSPLMLDNIIFPPKTLFANARLIADTGSLDISLAPGEIRTIPLQISSMDGKFIDFYAVLQKVNPQNGRHDTPVLTCNKTTFIPGSSGFFMFTTHNGSPGTKLKAVSISLPVKALAGSASDFAMSGQSSLPFTGALGNYSNLVWDSETGSAADSLRSVVKLITDVNLEALNLPYSLVCEASDGTDFITEGEIQLLNSPVYNEGVYLSDSIGELMGSVPHTLFLTANQNLMSSDAGSYSICVYYNGISTLTIPVNIVYDEDPEGFYDTLHLANYPNPISSSTLFAYSVPFSSQTTITIYNLKGQKVKTLVNEELNKGYYRSAWNLMDENNKTVANGVYFCKLSTASGRTKISKCLVLKQ